MSPRHLNDSSLRTVSFWQFARAHRYHVHLVRFVSRMTVFFAVIFAAIYIGDYLHARPVVSAIGGIGAGRFSDRLMEVITDVICDRLWPDSRIIG